MALTSSKRSREQAGLSDDEAESPAADALYDPSSPLYGFSFVDKLVQQYASSSGRAVDSASAHTSDMVCCPRAYEESFLREPLNDERQCVSGSKCEGLRIPCKSPFILREFIYPGSSPCPEQRTMCLMCRRLEVARMFFRYESRVDKLCASVRVSDHYNVIGVPGEYCLQDAIVSTSTYTGLPMPVVLHVRSAYEHELRDGVQHYSQCHFSDPATASDDACAFLARGATLRRRAGVALSNDSSAGAST